MAPIAVSRTYKGIERKRRPWANIHNILSEIKDKDEKDSIAAFDALFTKNIKMCRPQNTRKHYRNKENKGPAKELRNERAVETKFDSVNVTIPVHDTFLDSTFDRILAGPVFQQPKPLNISHKNKEFSINSMNTSENQYGMKSSASEPSCDDNTLCTSTWKTRKKPAALKGRKIPKHFAPKANPPVQFRNCKKSRNKNETLNMKPSLTSTPNGIRCNKEKLISPLLSPILNSVEKEKGSETSHEVIREENDPCHSANSLSKPHISIFNARKNILEVSFGPGLPEIHQFDPSCKPSNLVSPSVGEEDICSNFASHKLESQPVTVNAVLSENISNQLQSCKADERILSYNAHSDIIDDSYCEMDHLKESFTCKDLKCDSAKRPCMNGFENGSCLNKVGHECEIVNLRGEINRQSECEEKITYKSYDRSAVPTAQDLCENPVLDFVGFPTLSHCNGNSNQYAKCTEMCEGNRNLSSSKARNTSVILFDSWDSVSSKKIHTTSESPSENVEAMVCGLSQVLKSGMLSSHSQRPLYSENKRMHCAQESTVQNSKEESLHSCPSQMSVMLSTDTSESFHVTDSRRQPAQESAVNITDNERLLCTYVSKSRPLCESSVDTVESHICEPRSCSAQESAVHNVGKKELLCSNIFKKHLSQELSFLSIVTDTECSTMTVKKQKSLRRQSSWRLSHQVIPGHMHFEPQLKSPSFRDVYHISPCKTASKCKNEQAVAVPKDEEFKVPTVTEEHLVCVSDTFTARDAVLQRCHQLVPISFSEAFPTSYWLTCKKIGEGVYGEVFLSEGKDSSVLKVIPIEGETLVNGEPQKKFEEILSEIVIAMELSSLRNGTENRTHSFSELKRCLCVQGAYPKELIDLWEDYNNSKGSENDSPAMFKEDQLYIILDLANGGCDLEAHFFTTADQSHSIFIQTACALAVAEQALEFEHRDLHWGNVLVSPTTEKRIIFRLCGKEYSVPTKGVKVVIIDFTLSRMVYDGCCIYNDLSKDPALFTAEGDYQFEVYRLMQKHTLDIWHDFKPYTNLLWLHYLLDKMCTVVNYRCTSTKSHKQGMAVMQKLQDIVLTYTSAQDFILNELV